MKAQAAQNSVAISRGDMITTDGESTTTDTGAPRTSITGAGTLIAGVDIATQMKIIVIDIANANAVEKGDTGH